MECDGTTYRRNRRHLRRARAETPTDKLAIDHSDFESEREEEEDNDREPEPGPANDDPISLQPEPGPANDDPTSPQYVPQQTSSFGRVIRPPRRFTELLNI